MQVVVHAFLSIVLSSFHCRRLGVDLAASLGVDLAASKHGATPSLSVLIARCCTSTWLDATLCIGLGSAMVEELELLDALGLGE